MIIRFLQIPSPPQLNLAILIVINPFLFPTPINGSGSHAIFLSNSCECFNKTPALYFLFRRLR
jgi:hypothetical protein